MTDARMRTDGHRDGRREVMKCCPKCCSDDLRYDMKQPAAGMCRCHSCGLLFSKRSRVIKLTSF